MKMKQMPYKVEEGAIERAKYRAKMAVREAAHPTEQRPHKVQWRWATAVFAMAVVVIGVVSFVKYYDYISKPLSPMEELIAELQTAPDEKIHILFFADGRVHPIVKIGEVQMVRTHLAGDAGVFPVLHLGADHLVHGLSGGNMAHMQLAAHMLCDSDMLYRLDRDLESFLSFLSTQVAAPEQLLIVLTSDHGTSPSYNSTEEVRERFNVRQAEVITNAFIGSLYGNGDWILGCIDRAIYLNHNLITDKGLSLEKIQNDVATFVMQLRGVSQAVTAESMRGSYFGSGYGRKIQNGFYPRRSGDVVLNLMPEWIEEREQTRSMSGSMYRYDTQVPLIIYGAGCKAQLRNDKIDMTSLAATQAEILGIMAPSAAEGEEITIIYE